LVKRKAHQDLIGLSQRCRVQPEPWNLCQISPTELLRRLEQPYTMHGFRSTFRTWGMDHTNYPTEMLEFALAHLVGDQTVRAYARSDMVEKRRQLMEDWVAYIASQAGDTHFS